MKNLLLSILALGALFVPVASNSMFGRLGQRALPTFEPRVLSKGFANLPVRRGLQSSFQNVMQSLDNIKRQKRAIMKLSPYLREQGLISLRDKLGKIQESFSTIER